MPNPKTKKEIRKEIIRCGKDPLYFITNYIKIAHPIRGTILFDMYDFQQDAVRDFQEHRYNIILKARQLGISTTVAAYACWMALFHRDKNVLVVATKLSTAANLVKKTRAMYKNLPPWLRISDLAIDNKTSMELENGSQVKAVSTSGDAGRSEACSCLIIDEAAFVEGLDELWAGLQPTLSTGGSCIALSSPNGVGGWFHKQYSEAEEQKNNFNDIKLPWDVHPDHDQEWFDNESKNMSQRDVAQELLCSFNASGETVIHVDDIDWLDEQVREPKIKTGMDRNYWIWEKPDDEKEYLIVADVARGDGADHSTIVVFDQEEMQVVAEYKGKVVADIFAPLLFEVGKEYNWGTVVVETNAGGVVIGKLKDLGYPNIYHALKGTHEQVDEAQAMAMGGVAGFTMSKNTRPLAIAKFEEYIRNKRLKSSSLRFINEVRTFVWQYGRPQAMRGYNDDLVIPYAIACHIRDNSVSVNRREMEYKKVMIGAFSTNRGTIDTKIQGMTGYKHNKGANTTYIGTDGREHDLSWIIKG